MNHCCQGLKMSKKDQKKPASRFQPSTQKIPAHLEPYQDDKSIFWSFSSFDANIAFPGKNKPGCTFVEIAQAIKSIEMRTWNDILSHEDRDHEIEIYNIASFAQKRLQELSLDDVDGLWSFHLNGKIRLWGIKNQSLIRVIWLDPNHLICPSHKKHT